MNAAIKTKILAAANFLRSAEIDGLRRIISRDDRRAFGFGLGLGAAGGLIELAGIAGLYPFLAVLSNPELARTNGLLARFRALGGFSTDRSFILAFGVACLLAFLASSGFLFFRQAYITRFSLRQTAQLSSRLLRSYLSRPYAFFLQTNSAEIAKNVIEQADGVANGFLLPCMTAFSECFVLISLTGLVIWVDPKAGLLAVIMLGGLAAAIQLSVRRHIHDLGRLNDEANGARFAYCLEALQSIKEIKAAAAEKFFWTQFERPASAFASTFLRANILISVPSFLIQAAGVTAMMTLALFLVAANRPTSQVIPLLSLYAVAGYRLMPSMSRFSTALASMRRYRTVLDNVVATLAEALPTSPQTMDLRLQSKLELHEVRFAYSGPRGGRNVLNGVSFAIQRGTFVALVGGSGAGKTTLVDILMGLLEADSGTIRLDGRDLSSKDMPAWRRRIGYIPQSLLLSDASIAANIAFGVAEEDIDFARVKTAARLARLDEMIDGLPEGLSTRVGERGSNLSGGQRQRLGIARALYPDPDLLILDESTSALDGITERAILATLHSLKTAKTIIAVAHRETTIRDSDQIIVLREGRIADKGRFDELLARDRTFADLMAREGASPIHENAG